jgi:Mn-dependent DtxR family transcriptional regulator
MLSGDALSKEELQTRLGKSAKIVSTRLGELAKNGVVAKTADDKFRITAFGIVQAQREVLPKIRAKIKV